MLTKRTTPTNAHFKIVAHGKSAVLAASSIDLKTAASLDPKVSKYHGEIVRDANGRVDLVAEMHKHPDALWIRVKAIEADIPNDNGDYFPLDELVKYYHTFEGVPVFTNHENTKVELAKGKVVMAEFDPKEKSVYCTMFIDRPANPGLCRAIEEGYITDVSMGTQVEYSTCSICGKKAMVPDEYCEHVKSQKGRLVNGEKVYEKNFGLKFIEVSVVTDGACKDCTIREILDPAEFGAQMLRAAESVKTMVKESWPDMHEVYAGQAEITKLNEAMDLLSEVSTTMLGERQQIDMEFLSKIVAVLADLQHAIDELVDQGYGRIGQQQQPEQFQVPPIPQGTEEQAVPAPNPSIAGPTPTGVGKVTEPATAANADNRVLLSAKIKDLSERAKKIHEEALAAQGGIEVNNNPEKYKSTIEKIARVWENPSVRKFQTELTDGKFRIVIGADEILGLHGTETVASLRVADVDADVRDAIKGNPREFGGYLLDALEKKYAASPKPTVKVAEPAPTNTKEQLTEITERQLATEKPPLHPRENEVRQSITEAQLSEKHREYEYHKRQDEPRQSITEKQLHEGAAHGYDNFQPQDKVRDEITEKQLRDTGIQGNVTPPSETGYAAGAKDQRTQITEGQMRDWLKADAPKQPDGITEKQLRDQKDPLGRRLASKEDAKIVLAKAMESLVRTSLATGATPEEMIATVAAMTLSPNAQVESIKLAAAADPKGAEARQAMLRRSSFHGATKVASNEDIKAYLAGSLNDLGLDAEAAIAAIKVIASQKNALKKVSDAITAGIQQDAVAAPVSMEDMLKEALVDEENVTVIVAEADVKADPNDAEAFAKAAFEVGTKVAQEQGHVVATCVHVKKVANNKVEVEMTKAAKKDKKEEEKKDEVDVEARKAARQKIVEAQMPTGGMPPAPGGAGPAATGAGGGTTMPAPAPADPNAGVPPVSALGEEPAPGEGEKEDTGEALPPGSKCFVCGADDVDVRGGDWDCNACGAHGTVSLHVEVDNWPGVIEDMGAAKKGEEGDMGDMGMEGEGGIEMPPVGIAATFKVTPEMVKVAKGKPVGSHCPNCGSKKVDLSGKNGIAEGKCKACANSYKIESFVDTTNLADLWARIEWTPIIKKASRLACKTAATKKAVLEGALEKKGLTQMFAKADIAAKAEIISTLHDEGLLG